MRFFKIDRSKGPNGVWSHGPFLSRARAHVHGPIGAPDRDRLTVVAQLDDGDVPVPLPTGLTELADQAAYDAEATVLLAARPAPPPDLDGQELERITAILAKTDITVTDAELKEVVLAALRRLATGKGLA